MASGSGSSEPVGRRVLCRPALSALMRPSPSSSHYRTVRDIYVISGVPRNCCPLLRLPLAVSEIMLALRRRAPDAIFTTGAGSLPSGSATFYASVKLSSKSGPPPARWALAFRPQSARRGYARNGPSFVLPVTAIF